MVTVGAKMPVCQRFVVKKKSVRSCQSYLLDPQADILRLHVPAAVQVHSRRLFHSVSSLADCAQRITAENLTVYITGGYVLLSM